LALVHSCCLRTEIPGGVPNIVIAEIIPRAYDAEGRKTFRPDFRRHSGFRPTFPLGRFLSEPLQHWCNDLAELREFLSHCKYVSDQEQFGKRDFWQPPEQFERTKEGDCDDFALWSWRQVLHMNYTARFVVGRAGRYGNGHAWITFEKNGRTFLLEPLSWFVGTKLPRLSVLRYKPKFSVGWDGQTLTYYEHEQREFSPGLGELLGLCGEWTIFWLGFWSRLLPKIVSHLPRRILVGKSKQTNTA